MVSLHASEELARQAALLRGLNVYRVARCGATRWVVARREDEALLAVAKAEGDNAELVQVYPAEAVRALAALTPEELRALRG